MDSFIDSFWFRIPFSDGLFSNDESMTIDEVHRLCKMYPGCPNLIRMMEMIKPEAKIEFCSSGDPSQLAVTITRTCDQALADGKLSYDWQEMKREITTDDGQLYLIHLTFPYKQKRRKRARKNLARSRRR